MMFLLLFFQKEKDYYLLAQQEMAIVCIGLQKEVQINGQL